MMLMLLLEATDGGDEEEEDDGYQHDDADRPADCRVRCKESRWEDNIYRWI